VIKDFALLLYEYIYQDQQDMIRLMNTKHAQCTCMLYIGGQLVAIHVYPIATYGFLLQLQTAHKLELHWPNL